MIIDNTRFGTIEIKEEKIITMKRGIPGFQGRKRFVILNREESHPFLWYQSIDDPALAFVILNPYLLKQDYTVTVDLAHTIDEMSWKADDEDHLATFVLVNASSGVPEKMTANLMAPLIVNTKRFEAVQIIMQDSGYSHCYPLFEKKAEEEGKAESGQATATG